ncbi:hypothetical protein AtubIFM55763_007315 [Aspergillus tubingensis]|nr:hypothetical protein AtubIFM54640_002636 [Aspergillus tubingensis]GLA75760.1 hypothetical protein AtubIFM55763_007315 [Aspergillus tubingensis]GLB23253.1 hypothetical protein AtubIFM61612_003843 [Aspergillus tubingensis]
MAVRKTRTGRLARAAEDERHSVRSSLVKSSRTNPTRTGRQGVTQQSLNQPDEPLLPRLMSWSDTLAAVEEQSLETQEMDRHTKITAAFVKRTGEDLSLVQPAGLRSMPIVFQQVGCVIPKIHFFVQSASVAVGIPLLLHCHHRLHHRRKNGMIQHQLQLRLHGPLGVSSIQQAPTGDRHDVPASGPTAPKRLYELLGNDDEATEDNVTSQRPRRQRKSRYTNLPTEVDTALSVLYRELESNESLRREVEELRSENTKSNQTIRIRDLSIIALRRELDYRRSSDQEIETLRATATQLENAKKEIQKLRARNEALSAELQTSRNDTAEAQALVRDWKAKLSQLIGN